MSDAASWAGFGVSALALGISIWTRLVTRHQHKKNAINRILDHWESGSRLRNLTIGSDPFGEGLSKSVKAWRGVCQDGLVTVRSGAEHTLIREAQKAAIPVESILDAILAGKEMDALKLGNEIGKMQGEIEQRMQGLAGTIGRNLEPPVQELYM
jgi:hypothetical protein